VEPIRKRLTYANVMSSLAVFLILGGATAFAAKKIGSNQLKANSVTTGKIKRNAVTAKKIKKNAVTTAKIKNGAVTGGKIANNTVTGANINAESTPFSRVVAKLRGTSTLGLTTEFQNYPLSPSTYTQAAEEDDTYLGAVDVTFEPGCAAPREVTAFVVLDSPNPTKLEPEESLVALGTTEDKGGGTVSKRVQIGPFFFFGTRFEPGAPTTHTANLVIQGKCTGGSGIIATSGAVDVIGTK
jgi:hypothetical protein